MFSLNRYITAAVAREIPLELQLFLWHCIDSLPIEKDYLQVFKLSNFEGNQKIVHVQENPEYQKEYIVVSDAPITTKIYVIDDETHATMLYSHEY